MTSCERPSKRSSSDRGPDGPVKTYGLSIRTMGSSRRRVFTAPRCLVNAFSSASNARRPTSHSSRGTTSGRFIFGLLHNESALLATSEARSPIRHLRDEKLDLMRRRLRTGIVILLLIVLLGGAGYVGWVLVQRSEPVSLPEPTGSLKVGRQTYEWIDAARRDPYADGPRKLSVWLWYPVAKQTTGRHVQYAPGLWSGLHLQQPLTLFQSPFDSMQDRALDRVAPAPGRFPVVVLMPGMGLSAPMYAALAEDLASHGYLVAGVTPTYSANLTVLGGQTVESKPEANPPNLGDSTEGSQRVGDHLVTVWAADARFAAGMVGKQLPGSVEPAIGPSYVGHSFGGAAALEACRLDQRCAAAVDLDGSQFGDVVTKGVKAPIMLLGAEDSCITSVCGPDAKNDTDRNRALSLLKASTGTSWCATVPGTRHFNFTDYGVYYLAYPLRRYLPLGNTDPRHALTITNGYVTTFLSHAIYQTPSPGAPACRT